MNVIGGEGAVFTHFQDETTKTSMISSHSVMWAKRIIEGTDTCTKEAGTPFNLKTKRLDMRWTEITFNKINFIERGQRHLHVLSCIINMHRVGFKFFLEEMGKGGGDLTSFMPLSKAMCWAVLI